MCGKQIFLACLSRYFPSSHYLSSLSLYHQATCPYITSIGSTQCLSVGRTEIEAVFGGGGSPSGGFSNYFTAPSYQSSQVSSYIKSLGLTYTGLYNTSGRGFPDVSALGVNYTVVWEQGTIVGSGTSASAPTFASIVALLNDRLLAMGKKPLGFLNLLLYSAIGTSALTDIIEDELSSHLEN